ncbi:hypothetical protein GCM10022224_086590 [Nonomuraea antimicrobica]|uniref:AB hydrolase-1 domain-containing protein n=1 Tax=Nonomuraea antimicrobica TaxID=561173 RepID=A0ABP7DT74_9ACTN
MAAGTRASRGPGARGDEVGQGLALVLGHGFMLDSATFSRQVAALSDRYRVITWHARGHGATEYDGRPFTLWGDARDLIALLGALDIDRAVIGGHSMGGFVALSAALLAPQRVAGPVLVNTTPYGQAQSNAEELEDFADAWQRTRTSAWPRCADGRRRCRTCGNSW